MPSQPSRHQNNSGAKVILPAMSGLEVIGGISAVITIIDGSIKIWDGARKDLHFSATFVTVANRLPILQDTLKTCQEHLEPITITLPADAAGSLIKKVKNCETKAGKLRTIFEETIPGEVDEWYTRYRKVAQRLGKGSKVEELMKSITEDAQNLVNYHVVKSARPELCTKLEEVIEEIQSLEPSIPSGDDGRNTYNAYGGTMMNNTGEGSQNINTGSGNMVNYASGTGSGNPIFNFGKN